MNFQQFWSEIQQLGQAGGQCDSQGRGAQVRYLIDNGQLVCKSLGAHPNRRPHRIDELTAADYFDKLQRGMRRFGGKGGFRYQHSAWFHDIYAHITGNTRR